LTDYRLYAVRFVVIAPKPTEFSQRKEPSAAGAATKKETKRKTDFHHEGLGTPTSFLPRAARGRMKEGELQTFEAVCGEKVFRRMAYP
jgi:hypothetical protein